VICLGLLILLAQHNINGFDGLGMPLRWRDKCMLQNIGGECVRKQQLVRQSMR
jgi:hypothetical protein